MCPRALCDKMRVLPHGLSDEMRKSRCKVFCPKCEEVYIPTKKTQLDGASFGTSFAHMFLDAYAGQVILPPKVYYYEPQMFGFKISG